MLELLLDHIVQSSGGRIPDFLFFSCLHYARLSECSTYRHARKGSQPERVHKFVKPRRQRQFEDNRAQLPLLHVRIILCQTTTAPQNGHMRIYTSLEIHLAHIMLAYLVRLGEGGSLKPNFCRRQVGSTSGWEARRCESRRHLGLGFRV